MNSEQSFWTRLGKHRLIFGYAMCVISLFFARQELFLPGIGLAVIGIALRVWSAGYIHKNEQVTTGGPYALTRNPLYLGSFLFGLGGMLAIRVWWLLAVYVVGFFAFYYPTMRSEEAYLQGKFGGEFEAYRNRVPFFLPWKRPAGGGSTPSRTNVPVREGVEPPPAGSGDFSFAGVMRNKEHRYALGSVTFLLILEGVVRLRVYLGH